MDYEFVRTRRVIKLAELGTEFVSRSEAKRLLSGLELVPAHMNEAVRFMVERGLPGS
jgi:hypothetical protein